MYSILFVMKYSQNIVLHEELAWFSSHTCVCVCMCVCVLAAQSCPAVCNPMNGSQLGSSVHGIRQARITECVAILFFRGSS